MTPAAKQKRFDSLRELGCVACRHFGYRSEAEVHHLNLGGHAGQKRIGDEHTIPLCSWHHRGQWLGRFRSALLAKITLGPSLSGEPKRFREVFGTDAEMLQRVNDAIEGKISIAQLQVQWPFTDGAL